jgi:uncharacterized protein with HEPN domain
MQRDARVQLRDIEQAVQRVLDKAAGVALDAYVADRDVQDIVERQLITVGEAAAQLSKNHPDVAARLPEVAQIVGFRNRVVHGYWDVDPALIHRIIARDLRPLLTVVSQLLEEMGRDVPEVDL